jgi:hypothetical protein
VLTVDHVAGHQERHAAEFPADTHGPKGQPVKTQLHGVGSTLTYAQRRLTLMAFNIVTGAAAPDDDGNGPPPAQITQQQAADLRALAEEVGADINAFLKYMGAQTFAEIRASDHARAVSALEAKRRQSGSAS